MGVRMRVTVAVVAVMAVVLGIGRWSGTAWAAPSGSHLNVPHQQSGSAAGKSHKAKSALRKSSSGHRPAAVKGALPAKTARQRTNSPRASTAGPAAQAQKQVAGPVTDRSETGSGAVEVPSLRTANRSVYRNRDGSYTSRVYADPVHYKASDSSWATIDTTLQQRPDGTWQEAANSPSPVFADAAGSGPLLSDRLSATVSYGFSVQGASSVTAVVDGSRITYPGIEPAADVTYLTTTAGVKETLVLQDASAPTRWVFPLSAKGLSASIDSAGGVEFTDSSGRVRAQIPPGLMEDSKIDPRSDRGARSSAVTYSLTSVDGKPAVVATLDRAWLDDPARVYPVRVDPSVSDVSSNGSTYVSSAFTANYSGDQDLQIGTYGNGVNNTYLTFNVGASLPNDYVEAASLVLDNSHSWSCSARPVYVAPITSNWSVSTINHYPGLTYGSVIGQASFGAGDTCTGGAKWESIDLGDNPSAAGTKLVEGWAHGGANRGLAVYTSTSDENDYKIFDSRNTSYAPYLSVTYAPRGADYSVAGSYVEPTDKTAGSQRVTVTNRGTANWTTSGDSLGYEVYNTSWVKQSVTVSHTSLPSTVAPNASVALTGTIGALPVGQYYLCWDMFEGSTSFNTGWGVPTSVCSLISSANVPPQIDSTSPPSNVDSPSLTPELYATGHDPDSYPGKGITYDFRVTTAPTDGSTPATVADSGAITATSWVVPAGKLSWNQTYAWTVSNSDTVSSSAWSGASFLSTTVQQPLITSHLGAEASSAHGFDPGVGDYTTSATDATAAVAGPALSVVRSYNSQDPRTGTLFGAGWSTTYDMAATPDADGSGNVVVAYPDGHEVRFGLNPDGSSYTPPQGTYATLAAVSGGGYTLTDRGGTTYTFAEQVGNDWRLTRVVDADSRSETLSYSTTGYLQTVTNTTSNRSLHFTWGGTGHVSQVATDPVTTGGDPQTWTYGYAGDTLTKACPPTSTTACTTYTSTTGSTPGSHYRTAVLDAGPVAYWRLGDPSGTATATDEVGSNLGVDNGTYSNVTLGAAGPLPGTPATAASFTAGNSSAVQVNTTSDVVNTSTYLSVNLWFKTTATGTVLFSYQTNPVTSGATTTGSYTPALYIGSDGRLQAELWTGTVTPMSSAAAVNDGSWHMATLTAAGNTQALYLDGQQQATLSGAIQEVPQPDDYLGTGFLGGLWPNEPHYTTASNTGYATYFTGSIGEVAFYTRPLGQPAIAEQYALGTQAANELTGITTPAGRTAAQVGYDNVTDRATQVTDASGGTWKLAAPTTTGSPAKYEGAVYTSHPLDYWPLDETSGTDAANALPEYQSISYSDGDATYNNVTLGQTGPVAGSAETAAGFNGSSSYVSIPNNAILTSGSNDDIAIGMWFKTTATGEVLFDYQDQPIGTKPGLYSPSLYVGSDGLLNGEFYDGAGMPMSSPSPVNDGAWHFVMLTSDNTAERLYLDGSQVDYRTSPGPALDYNEFPYVSLGAGYISSGDAWPDAPNAAQTHFNGSIAQAAVYDVPVSADTVATLWKAMGQTSGATPATTVQVTDPGSNTLNYTYDPRNGGRLSAATDGLGNNTHYSYDTNGFLLTVDQPDGDYVTTTHDARGNVLSRTVSDDFGESSTSYETFPSAGTYAATDPRNDEPTASLDGDSTGPTDTSHLTAYTYSPGGDLLTSTNPLNAVTTDTYTTGTETATDGGTEPPGLLATSKDPMGRTTRYAYDAAGDLTQTVVPSGLTTTYAYDDLGRQTGRTVTSDSFPAGLTTSWAYDADNRMTGETDPAATDAVTGTVHTPQYGWTYDNDGNPLSQSWSDTTGGDATRTATATYTDHDQLKTLTDPLHRTTSYGYDGYGNTTSTIDPSGNQYSLTYNANRQQLTTTLTNWTGDPTAPSNPTSLVLDSRAYDPDGMLASDTDAMGRETDYFYDYAHRLFDADASYDGNGLKELLYIDYDAAGRVTGRYSNDHYLATTYTLDAAGRATQEEWSTSGIDRITGYTYNDDGQPTSEVTANGAVTEETDLGYDGAGNLTSRTVKDGSVNLVTSYTYDQLSLPTSMTRPGGGTTDYTHDAAGRLTTTIAPPVAAESNGGAPSTVRPISLVGYDTFGDRSSTQDPDGNITTDTYDGDGELTAISQNAYTPPGHATITPTSSATYNVAGQIETVTDPNGNVTANLYDQLGDLSRTTLPAVNGTAGTWHYIYDADGEQLSATDPTGAQTEATYDPLGQQLTSTSIVRQPTAAAHTTTYTYNNNVSPVGDPDSVTLPNGEESTFTFDAAGNLTSVTDPLLHETIYSYDVDQHLVSTQLPDGTATNSGYDAAGRLTSAAQLDATGKTLRTAAWTYDADGNLASATDADTHTTTYQHDALGRLTSRVEPVTGSTSITTGYGYDAAGQLTRSTDGNGNATTYTYNPLGLLETEVEPGVAGYTSTADRTRTSTYDASGHLTGVNEPGGVTQTLHYDALGRLTSQSASGAEAATTTRSFGYDGDGRITSVNAPSGTDTFTYDDRGSLLTAAGPSGSASYTYNADGQLTARTDHAGTAAYTYNPDGQVATASDPVTGATATYGYTSVGQLSSIGYGTGAASQSFTYNDLHQLTGQTLTNPSGTTEASTAYGYDPVGNVTSEATTGTAGAAANTYAYDQAGRLTDWKSGSGDIPYAYDADGNRTQAGTTTATYNARDELTAAGTTSYSYTARGTLASETDGGLTTSYTYDGFDQLSTAGSTSYSRDGLGRLASAGSATLTYNGTADTPVSDGTQTFGRDASGALMSVGTGSTGALALTNQHGDTTAAFTPTGTTVSGSTAYDPWGQPTATSGTTADIGFQGGWTDPTTGYVSTDTRSYSPATATFTSRDIRVPSSSTSSAAANLYTYGNDAPLTGADPTGHAVCGEDGDTWEGGDGYDEWGDYYGDDYYSAEDEEAWEEEEAEIAREDSSEAMEEAYGEVTDDSEDAEWEQEVIEKETAAEEVPEQYIFEYDVIGEEDESDWSAGSCEEEPVDPITEKPSNPRPEGQGGTDPTEESTPQPGTKTTNSGPSDEPVNTNTTAEINPTISDEAPYQPVAEPTAESDVEAPQTGAVESASSTSQVDDQSGNGAVEAGGDAGSQSRPEAETYSLDDLERVSQHLARPGMDPSDANDTMIQRIGDAIRDGRPLIDSQTYFMRHEMTEADLMDQGMSYDDAHEQALTTHPPGRNYDRDIIDRDPTFGPWWRKQNELEPR